MNHSSKNFNKKNNIWSDTLIENSLCDDICKVSSFQSDKNVIKVSNRDIESYEYSVEEATKPNKKNHLFINLDLVENKKEIVNKEKESVKSRIGPLVTFDENKPRHHIKVSELDNDDLVSKEIIKHLKESNTEIICILK